MRAISGFIPVALTLSVSAHAGLYDLTIDGTLQSGNIYDAVYYQGWTRFDTLGAGDAVKINLRINTNKLAADPISDPSSYLQVDNDGNIPTVVRASLTIGDSPFEFSLLGGPTFPPGGGAPCYEALADCTFGEDVAAGAGSHAVTSVESESLVFSQTQPNLFTSFSWEYLARLNGPPGAPNDPSMGSIRSTVAFDVSHLFGDEFFRGALGQSGGGGILYAGNGSFSFFSSQGEEHSERMFSAPFSMSSVTYWQVLPVPEAETWAMLATGGALLGWRLRRRNIACQANTAPA